MAENFAFYLADGSVRKTTPNAETSEALMSKAFSRLEYVRQQRIDTSTAPFVFEDAYEAMREACRRSWS